MKIKDPLKRLMWVKWEDAHGGHGTWQHLNEFRNKPRRYFVQSVGFLIRESKMMIHLASQMYVNPLDPDDIRFWGDIQIPKKMIVEQADIND